MRATATTPTDQPGHRPTRRTGRAHASTPHLPSRGAAGTPRSVFPIAPEPASHRARGLAEDPPAGRAEDPYGPKLSGTGETDEVARGVGEVADDHPAGLVASRPHDACPTEALRRLQRSIHVGNPDVEEGVTAEAASATDAAGYAGAVVGGYAIDERVVVGLGNLGRDRSVLAKGPAEQIPVVAAKRGRIAADDLEVNDWLSYRPDSSSARSDGRVAWAPVGVRSPQPNRSATRGEELAPT